MKNLNLNKISYFIAVKCVKYHHVTKVTKQGGKAKSRLLPLFMRIATIAELKRTNFTNSKPLILPNSSIITKNN